MGTKDRGPLLPSAGGPTSPGEQLFYHTTSGRTPVEEYLNNMRKGNPQGSADIRAALATLEEKGQLYEAGGGATHVKGVTAHLVRNQWNDHRVSEICYHKNGGVRVYVLEHDGHIVLLDAADKPEPNKQKQDIARAAGRAADWVERYKAGEFNKEVKALREARAEKQAVKLAESKVSSLPTSPPVQQTDVPDAQVHAKNGSPVPPDVRAPPSALSPTPPSKPPIATAEPTGRVPGHGHAPGAGAKGGNFHRSSHGRGSRGALLGLVIGACVALGLMVEEKAEAGEAAAVPPGPEPHAPSGVVASSLPSPVVPPQRAFGALSALPSSALSSARLEENRPAPGKQGPMFPPLRGPQ